MPNQAIQVADTASASRRLTRFDWIVLIVAVAVGASLSMMCQGWHRRIFGYDSCYPYYLDARAGALGGVVVFFIVGLLREAWDLASEVHGRSDLSREERWGWHAASLWRALVVLLLVAYYLLMCLLTAGLISPGEARAMELWWYFEFVLPVLPYVFLIVALAGTSPARPRRSSGLISRLVSALCGVVAVALCLVMWIPDAMMIVLVYIAVLGIEMAQPLYLADGCVKVVHVCQERFCSVSVLAILLLALNLGLTFLFFRQARSWLLRLVTFGLLATGLAGALACAVWLAGPGLYSLTPCLPEGFATLCQWSYWYGWLTALVLITILAAAGAQRLTTIGKPLANTLSVPLHSGYYHTKRSVLLLLLAVLAVMTPCVWYAPGYGLQMRWGELFTDAGFLWLATLILAVRGVVYGGRQPRPAPSRPLSTAPYR